MDDFNISRQTDIVLEEGCVKIGSRKRPLSPQGDISQTELVSLRPVHLYPTLIVHKVEEPR